MQKVHSRCSVMTGIKDSKDCFPTPFDQPVKARSNVKEEIKPISVPEFFHQTVEKFGNHTALVSQLGEEVTYREYYEKVIHFAKLFVKMGLEVKHSVAVLASNCPEWFYSQMAAIHTGSIIVGIYPTSSAEVVRFILENTKANIIVVDDSKQMEKIRQIRNSLPLLKAAIQINGPFDDYVGNETGYYKWSKLETIDVTDTETELNARLNDVCVNECVAILYTSGTEGMPKGVMLTHDNILFGVRGNAKRFLELQVGCERIISFLPLSHIAAQLIDIFLSIELAATVYFADKNALKDSLITTMQIARPTFFLGVPRIYEKFLEKIISSESNLSFFKKILMNWSRNVMLQHHLNTLQGNDSLSFQYKVASNFIGKRMKSILGLEQTKLFLVGGAPAPIELKEYFMGLDIRLLECYGMSETAGMQCYASPDSKDLNTVGKSLHGTEIKVLNLNERGEGEIFLRGRNIFMGYLGDEERTKEVLKEDGWLQTGDIGRLDCEGNLFITGRCKEIIITAGGENIPFMHIENLVKKELPILSNAFLLGDRRKYLTMLVTLKTNMDTDTGEPTNILSEQVIAYFRNLGLHYTLLTEILEAGPCPNVMQIIKDGIDRANMHAISRAQRIQKFALLPHDFSVATGELNSTLKIKRQFVCKIFEDVINSLYESK